MVYTSQTGVFFMRRSLALSRVMLWLNKRVACSGSTASKRAGLSLAVSLFLLCMLFSACSGFGGAATATPTASTQALSKIAWCGQPSMVFRDEGAFTPTVTPTTTPTTATAKGTPATTTPTATITPTTTATGTPAAGPGTPQTVSDWSVVKADLGFTVYLPTKLQNGACLVSAQATIHDPIFGGSFTIGYLLSNHTSLSISEAPLKSQNSSFQCNSTGSVTPTAGSTSTGTPTPPTKVTPSPTIAQTATQLCSGAKNTTNIVISGPGTTANLQQIFTSLQPDVNWIPVS
jgi:hypothetical protein